MRNRHFPRMCGSCQAPMARQETSCWHCGTQWATEAEPQTALRVIPGGAAMSVADARQTGIAAMDADRWTDEGGSFEQERVVARA